MSAMSDDAGKGEAGKLEVEKLKDEVAWLYQDHQRRSLERDAWQLQYGHVHLRMRMGSQRITRVFITLILVLLIVGVAATFVSGTRELGIALVVGAIFAGASFITQYWAVQVAKEEEDNWRLDQELRKRLVDEYADRIQEIHKRIKQIDPDFPS